MILRSIIGRQLRFQAYSKVRYLTSLSDPVDSKATDFISWNKHVPVKIRMEDNYPGNLPPILVPTMMKESVERFGDRKALSTKLSDGSWKSWTFQDYYHDVRSVALAFVALGLQSKEGVGIMASNSPEWMISSVASIWAGGLSCGIYTTSSKQTVQYVANNTTVSILVLENQTFLDNLLQGRELRKVLPTVKKIVLVETDIIQPHQKSFVMSWKQLVELGRLHHDNITWTSRVTLTQYEWEKEDILNYLPLSHVAALMVDCYMSWLGGNTVYFADKLALKGSLPDYLREVRPTRFLAVPRVWEKIQAKMQDAASRNSGVKKSISQWAKKEGRRYCIQRRLGPVKPSLGYTLAHKLVLSRVHQALGLDRAVAKDGLYSGAATLPIDTFEYFQSLGMELQDLLGCTETTGPQTTNLAGPKCKPGTVGKPYLGVRNSIQDPDSNGVGEISTRSRNVFMGYINEELQTIQTFTPEGWFKSGDLGRLDEEGNLIICGRIKELILPSGGKNIAPIPIETRIKDALPELISNVVVVGEGRHFLACLITPRVQVDMVSNQPTNVLEESVTVWLKRNNVPETITTSHDLIEAIQSNHHLRQIIQGGLEMANAHASSRPEKVQKFRVLPQEFSVLGEELGPTLKLKRPVIHEKYAKVIDNMYSEI
eukprot:maker-scaffold349_size200065-snap-gene-1.27 protein:Tk10542 transcript:maker-scaffold349_size200065-snap-gene-1.27-mRNA-1 annotation:"amp dependent ligase"